MKTILLTGANGGIGSATAAALRAAGAEVIGIDRDDADLASYADVKKLAEKDDTRFDWLVFAHGFISAETEFEKQRSEEIKMTFDINTLSCIYLTQLLLPSLREGGGIIFVSSAAGVEPNGRIATYSASKAAVNAFSKALSRNKPNLSFYSVCPDATNTAMREQIFHDASKHQSPMVVAEVIAQLVNGTGGYKSGDVILVKDGETSVASRI